MGAGGKGGGPLCYLSLVFVHQPSPIIAASIREFHCLFCVILLLYELMGKWRTMPDEDFFVAKLFRLTVCCQAIKPDSISSALRAM